MASQVTNYQCPSCGGPLHYNEKTGKLTCDFCGSSFTPDEVQALYAEKDAKAAAAMQDANRIETSHAGESAAGTQTTGGPHQRQSGDLKSESAAWNDQSNQTQNGGNTRTGSDVNEETAWDASGISDDWGEAAKGMKTYTCPSCGAELVCDASTGATSCPYCGNPTIIPGQFSGSLKPDYVIPFKVSHDDAVNALKKFYKGKVLLPASFRDENHIKDIQGVYVPFWFFDGQAEGTAYFKATRVSFARTADYEITNTDFFDVIREGNISFEKVPVDASSKMPDAYMDSLEPYNYGELKPFSTAYLPGFLANKYDVSIDDCKERADERCAGTLTSRLEQSVVGYNSRLLVNKEIHLKRGKVHYGLLPVWLLNTKWKDRNYLFAVNGQTGKIVGELPISWKRALSWFGAIAAPVAAVGSLIAVLLVR